MTKKDFTLIANLFRESKCKNQDEAAIEEWRILTLCFADALENLYVRFDRTRFLKACGWLEQEMP